jgi:hypothetical protein
VHRVRHGVEGRAEEHPETAVLRGPGRQEVGAPHDTAQEEHSSQHTAQHASVVNAPDHTTQHVLLPLDTPEHTAGVASGHVRYGGRVGRRGTGSVPAAHR